MRKNFFWFILVSAFIAGSLFVSCSDGSYTPPLAGTTAAPATAGTTTGTENSGGGTTQTDDGTQTGGANPTTTTPEPTPTPTPAPVPAVTYVITFNANDGSENPATATQSFTEGTPQALKTIAELGFSKSGFNFAGWGTSADASESSYADGANYTASSDITLYALWSAIPVYSVNIPANANGNVIASPATGVAGTEITLSNLPNAGYQFASYTVTDADGVLVTVTDGKFTLPAKNVSVTATFNAIYYNINVGTFVNGRVTANSTTATVGTSVTLTATPASGYQLSALVVIEEGGASVSLSGTSNSRTFAMPAKNVTVTASFSAINYTITCGICEHGTVSSNLTTAIVGTEVALANTPNIGWKLLSYTVLGMDSETIDAQNGKFIMSAKNVTVSAIFSEIPSASGAYTALPLGTDGSAGTNASYVNFGLYPQTIKASNVTIDDTQWKKMGNFLCYKGSDGEFYVSVYEKGRGGGKYSDGTSIGFKSNIERYFKLEPIKWRIVTEDYNGSGKKLLVAEKVLFVTTFCKDEDGYYTYKESYVRSELNGNFLNAAFTESEKALVADTLVDNSPSSSLPYSNGSNPYSCENTTDKIFALSMKEATSYGFGSYSTYSEKRRRIASDYSRANYLEYDSESGCGEWWLRTLVYCSKGRAHLVGAGGWAEAFCTVASPWTGVVPALCVSN